MTTPAVTRPRASLPDRPLLRPALLDRLPLLEDLAAFGDRVALVDGSDVITYAQLAERVEQARRHLPVTGRRRLVVLELGNTAEAVVSYLGALAGGHVPLPVPPDRPDVTARLTAAYLDHPDHPDLHPELALLLSTSGTAGSPKLVRLSARNLQANAESVAAALAIRADDRAITSIPLHYCYGLSVLHSHLLVGASVVLTDRSVTDTGFWDLMRDHAVTTLAGVPYTFDLLERVGFADLDLPALRYVTQAGGRLAPERVTEWAARGRARGWDLVVMYGQTEATARMTTSPPDLVLTRPESVGRPVPGGTVRLRPVPGAPDGTGELVYTGPNVMLGYAEGPADLALGRTVTELATGDLARIDADGSVAVVGRLGSFVKVCGLRVDLAQVEAALPGAVAGGRDDVLHVAVGAPVDADEVRRAVWQLTGLPRHMVRVAVLPELPRLANGKPDRAAALAAPEFAPGEQLPVRVPGPDADLEVAVRQVLADVLGVADVPAQASFTDLGGDSLSYVEASVRLERLIGPLPRDWHRRPVTQLATILDTPPSWIARLETTIVLRAVAIVLVVGTHADLFTLRGGAHVLLGVAGYNFARFLLVDEDTRRRVARATRGVARIALPTIGWVGAVALITADYPWRTVFLVNSVLGPATWSHAQHYWFVESLVWIIVAATLLVSVPPLRRWQAAAPFGFPLAIAAVGLVVRFELLPTGVPSRGEALWIFWIFAIGWAAATASRPSQRALLTAVVMVGVPGFFDSPGRETVVIAGLVLLIWVPTFAVPRLLVRPLGVLAAASLAIYLTQWQIYPLLDGHPLAALLASLLAGVAAAGAAQRAAHLIRNRRNDKERV